MPIRFEDSQRPYLLWFMLWQMGVGKWCVCHILCVFDGVFGEPCVGKCLLLPETASLCPIFSHLWEIYKCVCSQRTGRPNIYIAQFRWAMCASILVVDSESKTLLCLVMTWIYYYIYMCRDMGLTENVKSFTKSTIYVIAQKYDKCECLSLIPWRYIHSFSFFILVITNAAHYMHLSVQFLRCRIQRGSNPNHIHNS